MAIVHQQDSRVCPLLRRVLLWGNMIPYPRPREPLEKQSPCSPCSLLHRQADIPSPLYLVPRALATFLLARSSPVRLRFLVVS